MRKRRVAIAITTLVVALAATQGVNSAKSEAENASQSVHFVVDVSGSMNGQPLVDAKDALAAAFGSIPDATAVGLRSYAGSCGNGGVLRVPIATGNRSELNSAVAALTAGGGTPTADALRAAVGDLPESGDRTIILISDGYPGCDDPCVAAQQLVANEAVEFKVHTVGFNAGGSNAESMQCIADATGGSYFEADDPEGLIDAIGAVTASTKNLVVLGDSYSSGEGSDLYYPETTQGYAGSKGCHRSDAAWGPLLAQSTSELDLVGFFACSGEKINQLYGEGRFGEAGQFEQLEALVESGTEVDIVMLTIGGNDAKFANVLKECRIQDCGDAFGRDPSKVMTRIGERTEEVIALIRVIAGEDTEVVLVGYPRLFPLGTENTCNWMEPHEQEYINGAHAALTVRQIWAAQDTGSYYINSQDFFTGHELCTADSWLFPVSPRPGGGGAGVTPEQGHPTLDGYFEWYKDIRSEMVQQGIITG